MQSGPMYLDEDQIENAWDTTRFTDGLNFAHILLRNQHIHARFSRINTPAGG